LESLKQYILHISGLGLGEHKYHYKIESDFFAAFENTEFEQASIDVELTLEKQERMLILNFDIKGNINVMCDRCLENFDYPLDGKERLIVKLGQAWEEENEEVLVISEYEHQLDISGYLYDFIILMLPIRKIHPEDDNGKSDCNPEMLKKIEDHTEHKPDSRWDSLKGLITDN
jgi:uncharacterized metal-binding protein YceD (DUF177 family)